MRGAGVFSPRPVATSSDTARVVATAGTTAVKGSFAVTVEALARADVRTQSSALTAASADDTLHVASGATAFDVAVAAGDGIATIAQKINAAGGGVAASVVDGRLRLTATATGAAAAVALSSDGSLAGDLGMASRWPGRTRATRSTGSRRPAPRTASPTPSRVSRSTSAPPRRARP